MADRITLKRRAGDLRRNQTPHELKLWTHLRMRQVHGVRFLRQYVVGGYIVDFHAPSIRLAVELDGGQHYDPGGVRYDMRRTRVLEVGGIMVLRYSNLDVSQHLDDVLRDIARVVMLLKAHPTAIVRSHPPAAARRPPSCGRG